MSRIPNLSLTAFVDRLSQRIPLSLEERQAVVDLPQVFKSLRRHEYIIRESEKATHSCVLLSGFAIRHKVAGNGARQIFSIHMRGDAIDLHNALLDTADHNLQMLSDGEIVFIPVEAIRSLIRSYPNVGMAMWMETLVDAAIFREWTLNVGRRDARSRMAHMLCEFALRLEVAGLSTQTDYELPMTQEELGDALALTPIHISRTLKDLAEKGLVKREIRAVKILDWRGLATLGDFDRSYLHLAPV